jgi:hypothetical protein
MKKTRSRKSRDTVPLNNLSTPACLTRQVYCAGTEDDISGRLFYNPLVHPLCEAAFQELGESRSYWL